MSTSVALYEAQQPLSHVNLAETGGAMTIDKEVQFGDLILAFTTSYEYRWNDRGSGADDDVGFYHPIPPEGFFALGSIGLPNHDQPNGKFASLCVKASPATSGKKAPLAPPVRWEYVWDDSGSGADDDGSCWRPVPPEGYVALGDVFVTGHSAPTGTQVMCVAKELVFEGKVGARIWTDNGSGADRDFGAWQVEVSRTFLDTPDGIFAVNSFAGTATHAQPQSSPVAWSLRLPLPTLEAEGPVKPTLTSRNRPPAHTNPVVDRVVTVPFTAVADSDKTLEWKVANSPFYNVERSVQFDLLMFIDNDTNTAQSQGTEVTTGVTKEQSQTFSITTGITVSYESGIDAGGFSSKVSASLSIELGYSTTTSISQFRSETDQATLIAAPRHAAALWTEANTLRVFRADGSPVGPALGFQTADTAYVLSEFDFGPSSRPGAVKRGGSFSSRARSRLGNKR